jgi:hypothetical protein
VELEIIERSVLETVGATVRPVAASLWIRLSRRLEKRLSARLLPDQATDGR